MSEAKSRSMSMRESAVQSVTNTKTTPTYDGLTRTVTRRSSMTLTKVEEIDGSIDVESSEEIALIRKSMGMFILFLIFVFLLFLMDDFVFCDLYIVEIDLDLNKVQFNEDNLSIQEKDIIRNGRLFYSFGDESMAIYVQLYENVMQYFEDEECMEEIGQIDFRSITGIKYIDEDTFELHTVIHDKVHVFAMYDTKCHQAGLWVDDIQQYAKISRIEVSTDESTDYDENSSYDSRKNAIQPVVVKETPWYWYLCCCCLCKNKPEIVIYPTEDVELKENSHS